MARIIVHTPYCAALTLDDDFHPRRCDCGWLEARASVLRARERTSRRAADAQEAEDAGLAQGGGEL